MRTVIPEVVGRKEAAAILGILQNNLYRDVPEMPEPAQRLSTGPIWLKEDVEAVARVRRRKRWPRTLARGKRWRRIAAMWTAGASPDEIASEIGSTRSSVTTAMAKMRAAGYELPYRRAAYAAVPFTAGSWKDRRERLAENRELNRTDPERRRERLEQERRKRQEWGPERRERERKRQRQWARVQAERYATDPEFRAKVDAAAALYSSMNRALGF